MSVDPLTERFGLAIQVLPGDIDLFDHVNNVVYVGTRLHTRIRIETPLPDGPGHPDANALLAASRAAKWHPNIARMLEEEFSSYT